MATNKVYSISDEEFQDLIKNSQSFNECSRKLGYAPSGRYSYDLIKRRCAELGISTEHFVKVGTKNSPKYTLEEILVENSSYQNISSLKNRLISEQVIPYKCAICGNEGIWNNKPLVLQLDHINGKHLDHRKENLRFLCSNCHSQTDTFCTRQPRANTDE